MLKKNILLHLKTEIEKKKLEFKSKPSLQPLVYHRSASHLLATPTQRRHNALMKASILTLFSPLNCLAYDAVSEVVSDD